MSAPPTPTVVLHLGDALEILRGLPDCSVDSIVTDPPAGISFMGEDWDGDKGGMEQWVTWLSQVFREALRVLKPGGHGLVWALPRTSYWTALALHNAGFEIRDRVNHFFGSGFPKSLDISKAIDRAAGIARPVVGTRLLSGNAAISTEEKGGTYASNTDTIGVPPKEIPITAPATEEAAAWEGWGTALKPAVEDWWLIRKPIAEKTIAGQVLSTGTGAINVDGCRIGGDYGRSKAWGRSGHSADPDADKIAAPPGVGINQHPEGRWPAHLVFTHAEDCLRKGDVWQCADGCPVRELDTQSGERSSGGYPVDVNGRIGMRGNEIAPRGERAFRAPSTGGASRYFNVFAPDPEPGAGFLYTPKASRKEREGGLDALPIRSGGELTGREDGSAGLNSPRAGAGRGGGRRNIHPTVKPIALMRWLVRMVTPLGATVIDPFMGSGSTGVAAVSEGLSFVGIELDPRFTEIATARINHAMGATAAAPATTPEVICAAS